MSRPTDLPDWATSANYAAGPYSGNPNKAKPAAGVIAEGFDPNSPLPAEWLNFYLNNHAAWLDCIDSVTTPTPPTTSANTPQLTIKDSAGNVRHIVDHNGYPMGRRSEVREEWIYNIGTISGTATPITTMPRWSATVTGAGGGLTIQPPNSGYPANFAKILTTGGACAFFVYTAAPLIHTGNTFLSTVIEWEAGASNSFFVGTHSETAWMGLTDNPAAPASSNNYCWFTTTAGQANWQCAVANGGVVSTADSTVSNSSFTAPGQRFRIELHGSSSPYAGKARFFVNETLVQSIATNLPASAALSFVFGSSGAASSIPVTLYFGPMLATWNRQLSLAAL